MKHERLVMPILFAATVVSFASFIAYLEIYNKADRHFWYPIALHNASCSTFNGDVYLMSNSIGWRNWPYFLEVSTKRPITLGSDCTYRKIRSLPKLKGEIQKKLNKEQRQYIIEGF